jgi:lysophospholipase L1-like esterase
MRVLAGAALAAACALPATPAAAATLDSLFVEGDSLTVGSSYAIQANLSSVFRTITVDAEVGRNTPTGIARLTSAQAATVWVVALGTNDAPDPVTMRRNVKAVLSQAGTRPVLWVSVWRSESYTPVNRMLSRMDRKHRQLGVLRWDRYIRKNPHLLARDGIHLTPVGYDIRGRMIADSVRALLAGR